MKKKYQIFISSTYKDLIDERQAVVQAVLQAGHIPAGMELFAADNKTQLDVIKEWIDDSDIYILILGGRYGSIDPVSGLSYTEIEYQYALEKQKPLFAIVLHDEFVEQKVKNESSKVILELDNRSKYDIFKKLVLSKLCSICKNEDKIQLSVFQSIMNIEKTYKLKGWVKGDNLPDNSVLLKEIESLRSEKEELEKKCFKLESNILKNKSENKIGEYEFSKISRILIKKKVMISSYELTDNSESREVSYLEAFLNYLPKLTVGIDLRNDEYERKIESSALGIILPTLVNFKLIERIKLKRDYSYELEKFIISNEGKKFLAIYDLENCK